MAPLAGQATPPRCGSAFRPRAQLLRGSSCGPVLRPPERPAAARRRQQRPPRGLTARAGRSDVVAAAPEDEESDDPAGAAPAATNRHQLASVDTADEGLRAISCWSARGLPRHHTSRRGVSNRVQLSVYGDGIGGNLEELRGFLQDDLPPDAIGSVHLLPIYPSTGDAGFAPVAYDHPDPELGDWGDVRALADRYQVCLDLCINHLSPSSPQFRSFVEQGGASPHAAMWVRWRDVWPQGAPSAEELQKVRTRKAAPPVIPATLHDGTTIPLWCTFGDQQIDINPFSEPGWRFVEESLRTLCEKGRVCMVRLDAFGYVTKRAGTSCFMQEPECWELLERVRGVVEPYGVQLLCEVHEDFHLNVAVARRGAWTYDFALPLLVLHALHFGTAGPLRHWLSICPRRAITTLDTHDGMGLDDIAGLAPLVDVPEVQRCILMGGGNINWKHFFIPAGAFESPAASAEDEAQCRRTRESLFAARDYLQPDCLQGCYKSMPHQLDATYFSAVGEDPKQYLLARAVQFFAPGVPLVYYVGLLAGTNDYRRMRCSGNIRDLNRHRYSRDEAREALRRPVVQALLELCRFRNTHPAFCGHVRVGDSGPGHLLEVRWELGRHQATLTADMRERSFVITHTPAEAGSGADGGAAALPLRELNLSWAWRGAGRPAAEAPAAA